jgi:Sec-independent protein translocase protein TatA
MIGAEIIINVDVIAVLYGEKKIPEMAGSFHNEIEMQQIKNQKWRTIDKEKLESIADTLGINYQLKMKILSYDLY